MRVRRPATEERRARLSDTRRVEAFSDGVFAIVITLLVLDVRVPDAVAGHLADGLVDQWPTYVAYATSFLYVGIVWLNHHAAFDRIRRTDRGLHWANLGVLATVALLPFPTAVLSYAVESDSAVDARAAAVLYAIIAMLMCASWLGFFHYLDRHPELLEEDLEERFFARESMRAIAGITAYAVAGVVGFLNAPLAAMVIFFAVPAFYGATSQGLSELHAVMRVPGRVARRR